MFGGHDSNNMIVPMDGGEYSRYASARGPLAIAQGTLLPIEAPRQKASYGLHPALTELYALYQRKALAVVANTGEMRYPMTKADVTLSGVPREAQDHLTSSLAYVKYGFTTPAWFPELLGLTDGPALAARIFTFSSGVSMLSSNASAAGGGSRLDNPALLSAMAAAPIRTQFPNSAFGRQMKAAAQLIHASAQVGAENAVLTCSKGGFDTHSNEMVNQPALYRDLSASLGAFAYALEEIGAASRVTLYTETEFNRTLQVNQTGGSDHAWGGHRLVMGHSVMGGDVFGKFPKMALGGPDDAGTNGTWIPGTSNDQFRATVANWLGVGLQNIPTAFPSLQKFAPQDLAFVA
ncbi:MAG TPA: DUF1501 domain-containing protein [Bryobacteraceae bacterium]|jgi:uncharacterized protein (DUF1501 family)